MSASDKLGGQWLDLYHHTSPENARAIAEGAPWQSREDRVYFTTHPHSDSGYGSAAVHVQVPRHLAELDDEFDSGEQHYAVPLKSMHHATVRGMVEPDREAGS